MSDQVASSDLKPIVCDNCGSQIFVPAFALKTLAAELSKSGKEEIIPLQLFACIDCDTVQERFRSALSSDLPVQVSKSIPTSQDELVEEISSEITSTSLDSKI